MGISAGTYALTHMLMTTVSDLQRCIRVATVIAEGIS